MLGNFVISQRDKNGEQLNVIKHNAFSNDIVILLKRIVEDQSFEEDSERVCFSVYLFKKI